MNDLLRLLAAQNPDGGWPYRLGSSGTEPTVYALLAIATTGDVSRPAVSRALEWLKAGQRADGGWAPRRGVDESTWVTALVMLLPAALLPQFDTGGALKWILSQTGRESSWVERLRSTMISGRVESHAPDGWPWFPDTAAWVTPSALTILALRKAAKRGAKGEIERRISDGQEFLMSRMCADGGWNHGSSKALGYDGPSYPETTGVALASLGQVAASRLARSIDRAEEHLHASRSLEATSWLQIGLVAQRRQPLENVPAAMRALSIQEMSLAAISAAALRGANILEA